MARTDYLSARLWDLCAKQEGALSTKQLLDGKLSRKAIAHRVSVGRLWRRHPNVYAVGRPHLSRRGEWHAALLAGGDRAALSHLTAAMLWRLIDEEDVPVHISIPTKSPRGHYGGVILHRTASLRPDDVIERKDGLRVTTLERTHLDLTRVLGVNKQRAALRESEFHHKLDLHALRRSLEGTGRSPNHGSLRRLLDDWVPGIGLTRSELEARFLELCRRRRILLPEPQVKLLGYRVDFLWPSLRLVVETDGYEAHRGRIAFQEDRVRDRRLTAAGYEVLRFTWAEVVGRPRDVERELIEALERRASDKS